MCKPITQEILAEKLGISTNWANQLLNGRRNASFCLAKKMGLLTNTSPLIWMEQGHEADRQRAFLEVKLAMAARGEAA